MTRTVTTNVLCVILLWFAFSQPAFASQRAKNVLQADQCIADFCLRGPVTPRQRAYLGCQGKEIYLSTICSQAILVELFSLYCPECQRLAPAFNNLYQMIQADPFCRDNVRMIGIGAGCNDYEVSYFMSFYSVAFPLFTDPLFEIHKTLKNPRVPFLVLVQKVKDKLKVLKILHPAQTAQEQFQDLRSKLLAVSGLYDVTYESSDGEILITSNCHLWDRPNGEMIMCLLKGIRVRKSETVGDWCKVEAIDGSIQGWLPLKK
jgi:thiol-disulfide isomerase/thioredoxin